MRILLAAVLLCLAGCNDSTPSVSVDGGGCGSAICGAGEACVWLLPRPVDLGVPPAGPRCLALPSACANDPTCACLDRNGGSNVFCGQLGPHLMCGKADGQLYCTST